MIIVYSMLAWGMVIVLCWGIYENWMSGLIHIKKLHQVPCHKCKYFIDSSYLKCTVNPRIAGSEDAIDCRDYQPQ
jgi:hypothetical protein